MVRGCGQTARLLINRHREVQLMLRRMAAAAAALLSLTALSVAVAPPASASIKWTCYGYTATFADYRSDGHPTEATYSWAVGGDNCVGISPGRQIWIASAGRPWATIPGNGLADAVWYGDESSVRNIYFHTFRVWVASSGNYYCQTWSSDSGWDGYWWHCSES
jgi:hypothetical protein